MEETEPECLLGQEVSEALALQLEEEAFHLVEEAYHLEEEAYRLVEEASNSLLEGLQLTSLVEEGEEEVDAFPLAEEEEVGEAYLCQLGPCLEEEEVEAVDLQQPVEVEEVEEADL